jgi:hypothetical protein
LSASNGSNPILSFGCATDEKQSVSVEKALGLVLQGFFFWGFDHQSDQRSLCDKPFG